MSDKIKLGFCIHSHQPVGNYEWVFDHGATCCYLPFLKYMEEYPRIRATLHFTGPLLEWFDNNRPEFFPLLEKLVKRGQVEIMGGGFYEPIISAIPAEDAKKQIEWCGEFIEKKLGVRPTGIWCTERIWDPSLPGKISGTGIEYTLLDDTHFLATGLKPEEVHGYYITEREGSSLKVFPIDMNLRYIIPFKEPEEIIDYLLGLRDKGVKAVTYGDDGEKFGMWPGTLKWVYEDGWLKRFMEAMSSCSEIEVVPLADIIQGMPSKGLVYLPTASYQEMMEWSLFPDQGRLYGRLIADAKHSWDWNQKRGFLRGGIWDNFFAKYPESNRIHKKMLRISRQVREYGVEDKALRPLFKAQCNCGYWHGLFGGIYLDILRNAIYENLLTAEIAIDEKKLGDTQFVYEICDHDMDGRDEVIISGKVINCIISPGEGGSVYGIEHKPSASCITNVMMRHKEIYHDKIENSPEDSHEQSGKDKPLSIHDIAFVSSDELRQLIIYDDYSRNSFITHLLKERPDHSSLLKGMRPGDVHITGKAFQLEGISEESGTLSVRLFLKSEETQIAKTFMYNPEGVIALKHHIYGRDISFMIMAVEMNIMVPGRPKKENGDELSERGIFSGRTIIFHDQEKNLNVTMESDMTCDIVYLPIECATQSEAGFEKTFQGWNIFFISSIPGMIPDITLKCR